jgi:hypothetical protein
MSCPVENQDSFTPESWGYSTDMENAVYNQVRCCYAGEGRRPASRKKRIGV